MNAAELALHHSQIGLPLLRPQMAFVTVHLPRAATTRDGAAATYQHLTATAKALDRLGRQEEQSNIATCGVDLELWCVLSELHGWPLPRSFQKEGAIDEIDTILRTSPPYHRDGGHFYFHLKSQSEEGLDRLIEAVEMGLRPLDPDYVTIPGNAMREGRVYGRRQLHGLISAVDEVNFSSRALIGDEDAAHKGACFCLTQRFVHDWSAIGQMSEVQIEDMIGRDRKGNLLRNDYERAHVRRVRVEDEHGINHRIINLGQPFGNAAGGHHREEGVFVSAYAKSIEAFNATLSGMLGDKPGSILDEHLTVSSSTQGNIWYVPSAAELGLAPTHAGVVLPINDFFEVRSGNGIMYYNAKDYLHRQGRQPGAEDAGLSPRLLELAGRTFSRWHNNWYRHLGYPDLGHLREHLDKGVALTDLSIPERKGRTIKIMLGEMLTNSKTKGIHPEVFRIDAGEILVGVVPAFTLGTGVRVMGYLSEQEHLEDFLVSLDETSMAGHTVPDHRKLVRKGLAALIADARNGLQNSDSEDTRCFFQSVVWALEGVRQYFRNYAALAGRLIEGLADEQRFERENLEGIARRMEKLAESPPETFLEAAQLVFGMHCCLHLIGELISFGRLDQVLEPFLGKSTNDDPEPQEIIDAFWLKVGEPALVNRHYFDDWRTYGTCAVPYEGGALVPQGDKASQWVMQLTIGGYLPELGDPRDGCNEITRMCIRSARRLPVTAPCLGLRLTPDTPSQVLREAALAVLSGGACPYFVHDGKLAPSLEHFGQAIPQRDARDYCSDGCWEIIINGKSEFALTYAPVMPALEAALNQGATYVSAGPTYLRGDNISFQSPPAEDIRSFEEFAELFYRHYHWQATKCLHSLLANYGALWRVCPSPLLSSLIDGCMESGRDLTHGGARYHILAPQILGVPCAIDSLWAIKKLVFDPATAVTTLPELRDCLMCDWGYDMIQPIMSTDAGTGRSELRAMRFKELRESSLALPKFGSGQQDVDCFGGEVASRLGRVFMDILDDPGGTVGPQFAALYRQLKEKYELPERPFDFKLTPAFGSFEDYLGLGLGAGASADGRRKAATLSSNISPMPSPSDLPPDPRPRDVFTSLAGWNGESFQYALQMAGPVDINIAEDFPVDTLVEVLRRFAEGEIGSNILTISCGDAQTMLDAIDYPERYDLLRSRMGGWSEFFDAMFPAHQQQHLRRPLFTPPRSAPVDR